MGLTHTHRVFSAITVSVTIPSVWLNIRISQITACTVSHPSCFVDTVSQDSGCPYRTVHGNNILCGFWINDSLFVFLTPAAERHVSTTSPMTKHNPLSLCVFEKHSRLRYPPGTLPYSYLRMETFMSQFVEAKCCHLMETFVAVFSIRKS